MSRNDNPKQGFALQMTQGNSTHAQFPADYIQAVFVMWYNAQKPSANEFWAKLRENNPEMCPSLRELARWITDDFAYKALELDNKVEAQMDKTLIENKLEMLERQALAGQKMQDMAWAFLDENGLGTAKNAISLLVHGVRIEREARSVPGFMKDLSKKTDSELLDELKDLLAKDDKVIDITDTDDDE
jgi:hypothetical protein